MMVIFETTLFTQQIQEVMSDDDYTLLQRELCQNPKMGDLIPGTGGLRKVRWSTSGKGKRGGARVFIIGLYKMNKFICFLLIQKINRLT